MRGDRVEIVVDVGEGVRNFEVVATRDGRRVEVSIARGQVEVIEVTRSGRIVRTARFMASRVVALVEYPAAEGPGGRAPPRRVSEEAIDPNQLTLALPGSPRPSDEAHPGKPGDPKGVEL
jgi:hypothetical protein